MTTPRSARRQAVPAARAGETVRGPILANLPCGCCVDDAGGVWAPCPGIEPTHTKAVEMVRHGLTAFVFLPMLNGSLREIAAHVAEQERAAHGMTGEQGELL